MAFHLLFFMFYAADLCLYIHPATAAQCFPKREIRYLSANQEYDL